MRIIVLLQIVCLFLFANNKKETSYFLLSKSENESCKVQFSELLQEGLKNHPSISMSEDAIKASEYGIEGARWGYFPTPSVDVSHKSGDYQTVARLDQPLWSGGKIDAEYDRAFAKKDEALGSLSEIRFNLISKYYDTLQIYLESEQRIKLLNKNKEQFLELGEMLDRMIDAGVSSQTDKDLLDSRLSTIHSDLVRTKAKLKLAKVQFEILTSRAIKCAVEYDHNSSIEKVIDVDKMIGDTISFHPSLKLFDSKIKAALSDVDTAKSALWPSLVLRAEHKEGTIYDESQPETENLVYVAFQMNTGAGLSSVTKISEAKINVSKLKFEKQSKEKDIVDNLLTDYTTFVTAKNNISIVAQNIIRAKNIYESDKRLYLSGKKEWLDLVNSLSKLSLAETTHSRLIIEKKVTAKKMDLQSGKISLEKGVI